MTIATFLEPLLGEKPLRTCSLYFKSIEFMENEFLLLDLVCGPLFQLPWDTNTEHQIQVTTGVQPDL